MILDVDYKNYKPQSAFMDDNWVRSIFVFNTGLKREVYCHRTWYQQKELRPAAVGVWHVKYK